jgi:hypothetical protein
MKIYGFRFGLGFSVKSVDWISDPTILMDLDSDSFVAMDWIGFRV